MIGTALRASVLQTGVPSAFFRDLRKRLKSARVVNVDHCGSPGSAMLTIGRCAGNQGGGVYPHESWGDNTSGNHLSGLEVDEFGSLSSPSCQALLRNLSILKSEPLGSGTDSDELVFVGQAVMRCVLGIVGIVRDHEEANACDANGYDSCTVKTAQSIQEGGAYH